AGRCEYDTAIRSAFQPKVGSPVPPSPTELTALASQEQTFGRIQHLGFSACRIQPWPCGICIMHIAFPEEIDASFCRSFTGPSHDYREGSVADDPALVSLYRGNFMDRAALLLQPGERPVYEDRGHYRQTQDLGEHDSTRPVLVPLELGGDGVSGPGDLGTSLRWARRRTTGGRRGKDFWTLLPSVAGGVFPSLLRNQEDHAQRICAGGDHGGADLRRG